MDEKGSHCVTVIVVLSTCKSLSLIIIHVRMGLVAPWDCYMHMIVMLYTYYRIIQFGGDEDTTRAAHHIVYKRERHRRVVVYSIT